MRLSGSAPLLFALFASSWTGCASQGPGRVRVNHYVFGLAAGKSVDIRDLCASGQAHTLELSRTLGDYAWSVVTLGVYLPHHVQASCVKEAKR